MMRSIWDLYGTNTPERVVYIVDLDLPGRRSVTNDAENVVRDVNARFPGWRIIYRDSDKHWDELLHENGVFKGFKRIPPCFEPKLA